MVSWAPRPTQVSRAVSAAPRAMGLPVLEPGNGVGGMCSTRCDRGAHSLPAWGAVWLEGDPMHGPGGL